MNTPKRKMSLPKYEKGTSSVKARIKAGLDEVEETPQDSTKPSVRMPSVRIDTPASLKSGDFSMSREVPSDTLVPITNRSPAVSLVPPTVTSIPSQPNTSKKTAAAGGTSNGLARGGTQAVAAYQKTLNNLGSNLKLDGAWGDKTQAAFEKAIADGKVNKDGTLVSKTAKPIMNLLAKQGEVKVGTTTSTAKPDVPKASTTEQPSKPQTRKVTQGKSNIDSEGNKTLPNGVVVNSNGLRIGERGADGKIVPDDDDALRNYRSDVERGSAGSIEDGRAGADLGQVISDLWRDNQDGVVKHGAMAASGAVARKLMKGGKFGKLAGAAVAIAPGLVDAGKTYLETGDAIEAEKTLLADYASTAGGALVAKGASKLRGAGVGGKISRVMKLGKEAAGAPKGIGKAIANSVDEAGESLNREMGNPSMMQAARDANNGAARVAQYNARKLKDVERLQKVDNKLAKANKIFSIDRTRELVDEEAQLAKREAEFEARYNSNQTTTHFTPNTTPSKPSNKPSKKLTRKQKQAMNLPK